MTYFLVSMALDDPFHFLYNLDNPFPYITLDRFGVYITLNGPISGLYNCFRVYITATDPLSVYMNYADGRTTAVSANTLE